MESLPIELFGLIFQQLPVHDIYPYNKKIQRLLKIEFFWQTYCKNRFNIIIKNKHKKHTWRLVAKTAQKYLNRAKKHNIWIGAHYFSDYMNNFYSKYVKYATKHLTENTNPHKSQFVSKNSFLGLIYCENYDDEMYTVLTEYNQNYIKSHYPDLPLRPKKYLELGNFVQDGDPNDLTDNQLNYINQVLDKLQQSTVYWYQDKLVTIPWNNTIVRYVNQLDMLENYATGEYQYDYEIHCILHIVNYINNEIIDDEEKLVFQEQNTLFNQK